MSPEPENDERSSPFMKLSRLEWAALVFVIVLIAVALLTKVFWADRGAIAVAPVGHSPAYVPWSVVGTRDEGRTLIVLPYGKGNICASWVAALDSAPTETVVRIHVLRKTAACGNEAPKLDTIAPPVAVPLGSELAGRAISGEAMQPIRRTDAGFESVVRRGRRQVAVPSISGMTVFDASEIVRAYGFTPVHDAGVSRNATVVAQRPAPTTLRERANPGRVRMITALTAP